MALNATMFRFGIDLSDLNRNVYEQLSLHVALHPSETMERMCLRVLAMCLFYDEQLMFTKGLSTDDEPDLWQKSFSDEIEQWIEIGKPDMKRLKKALGRSKIVRVVTTGGQDLERWMSDMRKEHGMLKQLNVVRLHFDELIAFAEALPRSVQWSVLIQDNLIHLTFDGQIYEISVETLFEP